MLRNHGQYQTVLNKECLRLADNQEIPIIDHSFHDNGLKTTVKLLIKYIIKYIMKKPRVDNRELGYLLKNGSRRKVLERGLKD